VPACLPVRLLTFPALPLRMLAWPGLACPPARLQDGSSFLNVPFWSDNSTELYSVTIISGPCRAVDSSNMSSAALAAQLQAPGCNVRAADNTSLVPTLLRDATVNTSVPLVIRILTNVTLGPNLQSPIVIRRPVLLLGTASSPVSVDFGMVVNQLDATAEYAQVAFQSIVLENLAPGGWCSSRVFGGVLVVF
jgi:hypothetical protein